MVTPSKKSLLLCDLYLLRCETKITTLGDDKTYFDKAHLVGITSGLNLKQ